MAILDWPTTEEFRPLLPVSIGPSTPKQSFVGAYTGERQVASRLADRLVMDITLPATTARGARRRAAFLASLASTGDWVRMPAWSQRYPLGTIGGSPTINGAVAAGARSVTLASATVGRNILISSSFEIDSDANGRSDNWTNYSAGSPGSVTYALSGGTLGTTHTHGTYAQRVNASALAAGTGNRAGVVQTRTFTAAAFSRMSAAVDVRATAGVTVVLEVDFFDSTPTLLSAPNTSVVPGTSYSRLKLENMTVPATAVRADFYVWMQSGTGAAAFLDVDAAQLESGSTANDYFGFPSLHAGDLIAVGGNLLMVGPNDATLSDAGGGAVNMAMAVPRAISNGAAVTYQSPTGVWQLDTLEAPPMEYSYLQGPVMLSFRQVAQ